ncbi:protein of unknown function [Mesotoga infera]|uniref:Uncharacterized protein n=1 Tax=Mesotoga infera TaxID=1236046 RepID=A0A7Z7LFQ4_9BACT|nr:protein of unknown function [Mesotoga infera]
MPGILATSFCRGSCPLHENSSIIIEHANPAVSSFKAISGNYERLMNNRVENDIFILYKSRVLVKFFDYNFSKFPFYSISFIWKGIKVPINHEILPEKFI